MQTLQPQEKVHSKIGASSAYRWFACPGSVSLASTMPKQPSSVYAAEGTAAHELADMCLSSDTDAIEYVGQKLTTTFNDEPFEVTEEMADAVQVYLDVVRENIKEHSQVYYEEGFDLGWIHEGLFGTNDACIVDLFETLHVFDYKHGKGHAVDVVGNKQLMYYALGAGHKLRFHFKKVKLWIVQPRAPHTDGPVRSWEITVDELLAFKDELKAAAVATEQPDAPLSAGDHCGFCPAAGKCPALREKTYDLAQAVFKDFGNEATITLKKPDEIAPEQMSRILESANVLDGWIRSVEQYALSRALQGFPPEGFKLVEKGTHRKWSSTEAVEAAFKDSIGDKLYTPRKVISPAQLEKLVGKAKAADVAALTVKPKGEPTLAPLTDKRPAINMSLEHIFAPVLGGNT
jgi:hypothetical protein